MSEEILTKICNKCRNKKELSFFRNKKGGKFGKGTVCKNCTNREQQENPRTEYNKKYREKNRENLLQYEKVFRDRNREKLILFQRNDRIVNKEAISKRRKQIYKENPEKCKKRDKKWRDKNPEKLRGYIKKYKSKNKLSVLLREKARREIKAHRAKKMYIFSELLGCTIKEAREHLESKFTEGMTWDNHGYYGWHIDHVKPIALFDLTIPKQQKECFNYKNLQPLWWQDNLSKGAKYNE